MNGDADDFEFDQYALERIMLGKWLESPNRCAENCAKNADIIVAPSFLMHALVDQGASWDTASQFKCTKKHPLPEWAHDMLRLYWKTLMDDFFTPGKPAPLIVVQSGFTNSFCQELTLSEMPDEFIRHVVLVSIESNMRTDEKERLRVHMSESPDSLLLAGRSTTIDPTPLTVTMPYPVSILEPVEFVHGDGLYKPPQERRIALSLLGTARAKSPRCWIRKAIMTILEEAGAFQEVVPKGEAPLLHICAKGIKDSNTKFCGLGKEAQNMWSLAVNSDFCLQPAGDSMTRSHLYIAILSGCIPVIIDGGHDKFSDKTFWAWRSLSAESEGASYPFVDYSTFALVYDASDVRDGRVDLVKEITNMPSQDPERLATLRAGLDAVAPRMRYAFDACTAEGCTGDAFDALKSVLRLRAMSQGARGW